MDATVIKLDGKPLVEQLTLEQLAELANAKYAEADQTTATAMEKWIEVGNVLLAAKAKMKHGEWGQWVNDNLRFTRQQAAKYMKLAEAAKGNSNFLLSSTLEKSLRVLASTQRAETGRPARPRNQRKRPPAPETDKARAAIADLEAEGIEPTRTNVAARAGVSEMPARVALTQMEAEQAVLGLSLDAFKLSASATQKLELHKRKFEKEFDMRVQLAVKKWRDEHMIPALEKKIDELKRMLTWPQYAVMTAGEYKTILRCLHPDSAMHRTHEQLAEAFRIFTKYKLKMVDDKTEKVELERQLRSGLSPINAPTRVKGVQQAAKADV